MSDALALLLAVEESGESGSAGPVVFWLIGTCWGMWFLRRRRHLGRISAFLLCLLIWPLLVVWALGRAVFRRKHAEESSPPPKLTSRPPPEPSGPQERPPLDPRRWSACAYLHLRAVTAAGQTCHDVRWSKERSRASSTELRQLLSDK